MISTSNAGIERKNQIYPQASAASSGEPDRRASASPVPRRMLNTLLNRVSNSVCARPRSTDVEKNHWPKTAHSQRGLVARECTMANSTNAAKADPAQRQG